jgi:hypothetical protein
MMKQIVLAAVVSLLAVSAYAQGTAPAAAPSATPTSCKATATEKKLAGAALKSFMTKCEKDAKASCDLSAKDKKLAGAARNSHVKKCVTDTVGS